MARLLTFENVAVLEISEQHKEKEVEGKKVTQTYRQLAIYEYGQKWPSVRLVRLPVELVAEAQKIVGKRVNVVCSMFENFTKKTVDFTFQGVAP